MNKIQWLNPKEHKPENGKEYLILIKDVENEYPFREKWFVLHTKYEIFKDENKEDSYLVSLETDTAFEFSWEDIDGFLPIESCIGGAIP